MPQNTDLGIVKNIKIILSPVLSSHYIIDIDMIYDIRYITKN